jgi:hypothetical protein
MFAVRHPDRARSALGAAGLDRVTVFAADGCDEAAVAAAVAGVERVAAKGAIPIVAH